MHIHDRVEPKFLLNVWRPFKWWHKHAVPHQNDYRTVWISFTCLVFLRAFEYLPTALWFLIFRQWIHYKLRCFAAVCRNRLNKHTMSPVGTERRRLRCQKSIHFRSSNAVVGPNNSLWMAWTWLHLYAAHIFIFGNQRSIQTSIFNHKLPVSFGQNSKYAT